MALPHDGETEAADSPIMNMNASLIRLFSKITRSFGLSAIAINSGQCNEWAIKAFDSLERKGIEVEIWSTLDVGDYIVGDEHVFIKVNGLFFDAEAIAGVKRHSDLPFYKRCKKLTGRIPEILQIA